MWKKFHKFSFSLYPIDWVYKIEKNVINIKSGLPVDIAIYVPQFSIRWYSFDVLQMFVWGPVTEIAPWRYYNPSQIWSRSSEATITT